MTLTSARSATRALAATPAPGLDATLAPTAGAQAPAGPQGREPVLAKAGAENFPVAMRVLPAATRRHLLAVYGFARFVDDVGDLAPGDRLAQLAWVEEELDRALAGRASHPIFVAAGETARAVGAERRPFADLIEANRVDQRVTRYATFEELAAYCRLSANPVGRLVLAVFGRRGRQLEAWSDSICTGLQLVEHWQDVAEDFAAGRVYLPAEDLAAFGVLERELSAPAAGPASRRLMAFEAGRARRLLEAGRPLVGALSGFARVAVAGFLGGGLAQLDALAGARYDVLAAPVKASARAVAGQSLAELAVASGAGRLLPSRWRR